MLSQRTLTTLYTLLFKRAFPVAFLLFFILHKPYAQEYTPIGLWRLHLSYNSIHSIAAGEQAIYAATTNGIIKVDLTDRTVSSHNKIDGLSSSGISALNFNIATHTLVVAYEDGLLDIIQGNTVTSFDRLKHSTAITGSKKIHHISFKDHLAFLSSDFGVTVFDLARNEIRETWRDLGINGSALKIIQSTLKGDSIFLATENGVIGGDLEDNLLDFENWKRFQQGDFNGPIQSVATFNDRVYAALSDKGLYSYENGYWNLELFLQNEQLNNLSASSTALLIVQDNKVWKLNTTGELSELNSSRITSAHTALADADGHVWIGDLDNGLLGNSTGEFVAYRPDGPASNQVWRLKYHNRKIYGLQGGFSSTGEPLERPGMVHVFSSTWSNQSSALSNITSLEFRSDHDIFAASFGMGVSVGPLEDPQIQYDQNNSTLRPANGNTVYVSDLKNTTDGLWVANYNSDAPLHVLRNNTWSAFSFPYTASEYPTKLATDHSGNVWMLLDAVHGAGILVFNPTSNKAIYLTNQPGSGGLPDRVVHDIAVDRDGFVWIGTEKGIAYFLSPYIFENTVNAILPIYEGRFLLSNETVTAIAVDGGNRKWVGTKNGVWLFNATADQVVHNFTTENSPLLSNVILDIEINDETGEVFFATDQGLASFRSDATPGGVSFENVKIFPNPVTPEFNGTVGISGLATDAVVKITDVSGKLVWQTQAHGGTATWNGNDYQGRKAATGVYLVFCTARDGTERFAGKIAIIR